MKVLKIKEGIVLEVQVKPKSKNFAIKVNEELVIFCRQTPVEGKVNQELIKKLSKIFGRKVEILSGFRSKTKRLLIKDAAEDEVLKRLTSLEERR